MKFKVGDLVAFRRDPIGIIFGTIINDAFRKGNGFLREGIWYSVRTNHRGDYSLHESELTHHSNFTHKHHAALLGVEPCEKGNE